MSLKLTGRSFQDPNVKVELLSLIRQLDSTDTTNKSLRQYGVTMAGNVDGANRNYTLSAKFNVNTIAIYVNGVRYFNDKYKIANNTVTFNQAPHLKSVVRCDYDAV